MKICLVFVIFCLGVCSGLPASTPEVIKVAVVQDEPNEIVKNEKVDIVTHVKQVLDEVEKTTDATPTEVTQNPVQIVYQTVLVPADKDKKTRRTRPTKPTKAPKTPRPSKPPKERPLIDAYIDFVLAAQTSTAAPVPVVAPNAAFAPVAADTPAGTPPSLGTYITNIETLQIGLTGMASDIDQLCETSKPTGNPASLDPLRNPFIQFLQNITKQQSDLTNSVLQYWQTANPALNVQPLTLPTVKPLQLPAAPQGPKIPQLPQIQIPQLPQIQIPQLPSFFRTLNAQPAKDSLDEVDEKLKGLEEAIKKTITEMIPYMKTIVEFPGESASTEEWEKFNEAIEFVSARLKNKTIQAVLDKEKTKTLVENYDKYLDAVQLVRFLSDLGEDEDKQAAVKSALSRRKGC